LATEYEWKFRATEQVLAEIAEEFPQEGEKISMETTYYDTPTGALSNRHYTLRRRLENGVAVCTLKAPAGTGRGEWEVLCDGIQGAVSKLLEQGCPRELSELVQEGLVPVCGARFTRIAKTVILPNGSVELALDHGVFFGGGGEAPLCEAEVELKSGTEAMCDAFAGELAARFALAVEEKSKFARALALYKGE